MIDLFRKFTAANLFFLTVMGFLLCLGALLNLPSSIQPILFEQSVTDFLRFLDNIKISPLANVLITLTITIIQAVLFNGVVNKYNLLGSSTFLPALMYVTTASLLLPFLALSPPLLCNFLLIWMLDKLLSIYHMKNALAQLFDIGMMVAVGSLIYFPFLAMFPVVWGSLILFRPFNWREWTSSLIGFGVVYYLVAMLYFWNDRIDDFYTIWSPFKKPFPFLFDFDIDIYDYLVLIPLVVIMLFFLNTLRENYYKSVVHVRKAYQLLFFMLLFSLGSVALTDQFTDYHFLLCVPPLSVYMAYYFNYSKTKWLYESIYIVLLLSILYFQVF